jgi:hypothetical protein
MQLALTMRDNLISPNEMVIFQVIAIPIGAYLLLYKPIERTKAVFAKVEELLRVGQSNDLLKDFDLDLEDDQKPTNKK